MKKTKILHLALGPILFLLSFTLIDMEGSQPAAIGIALWMMYWWISEAVPLYVTALLPLVFGVGMQLISKDELALSYGNHMIFLFLGGFLLARAIEKSELHVEISRFIINLFGGSSKGIVMGFMLATALLSMWISNTATTLMMLPMALSVLKGFPDFKGKKKFSTGLLLSIAFAANIGGAATLVGTPPNSQMAGILSESFDVEIGFAEWMTLGVPFSLVMLVIAFIVISFFFLKNIKINSNVPKPKKLNSYQIKVAIIFSITVIIWILRKPIIGWTGFEFNDAAVAIAGSILLFIIPRKEKTLLVWKDTRDISWGILILFGGGLALAKILENAGVVDVIINSLKNFDSISQVTIILAVITFAVFATELMSNLALVVVIIPIIGSFALEMDIPIVQICAGVALAASCAFMLPVATPPNAIVFSSGEIKVKQMVRVGFVLNIISVLMIFAAVHLLI